ncbi:DUF4304 domain-containing protein [Enterococcus raffinosus]|uniref:DUF4304 domain-containing protein n=1 Tax=Enterococcus raffinosus TaxID=71452 RepID=UPI001C104D4D|nr:DUF4304 domain-containing protein [Enterococcus raffinosus]MBU5363430.1 DUF4304 domain-containing protein [Enterococcus raffinosus]
MENKDFKLIVKSILEDNGFSFRRNTYYQDSKELIVCIDLQKSNFSKNYYINYGFLIKELHPDVKYPKTHTSDITGRFFIEDGRDEFEIDSLTAEEIQRSIQKELDKNILPTLKEGISYYFKKNPEAKAAATLRLKKYLGIE